MEDKKLDITQATAIVPSPEPTAELIPQSTAELIEKSFAENTVRNRRQALQQFQGWLQGREIRDGLLARNISRTYSTKAKPLGQSVLWSPR